MELKFGFGDLKRTKGKITVLQLSFVVICVRELRGVRASFPFSEFRTDWNALSEYDYLSLMSLFGGTHPPSLRVDVCWSFGSLPGDFGA